TAFDFDPCVEAKQHEGFLKLEFDTSIGLLRSITGYSDFCSDTPFDFDGSYLPAFYGVKPGNFDDAFQQTIDYSITAIDRVNLLVGGQYFNIKSKVDPSEQYFGYVFQGAIPYPTPYTGTEIPFDTYVLSSQSNFRRTKEAWAIFGDATFEVTDQLSITVGGRYSKENIDVKNTNFARIGGTLVEVFNPNASRDPATGLLTGPGARADASFSKFTPSAAIRYEITPRTSIYATYS